MRHYFSITNLLITIIVDLLALFLTEEWTKPILYSLVFTNIAFVVGLTFTYISPKGNNANIFVMSSDIISTGYLLTEIIISFLCINLELELNYVLLMHLIIMVVSVAILLVNFRINKTTNKMDVEVEHGMIDFREIQENLKQAMDNCDDYATKTIVESVYDASKAMTRSSCRSVDKLNSDIVLLSKSILDYSNLGSMDVVKMKCNELRSMIRQRERLVCER